MAAAHNIELRWLLFNLLLLPSSNFLSLFRFLEQRFLEVKVTQHLLLMFNPPKIS